MIYFHDLKIFLSSLKSFIEAFINKIQLPQYYGACRTRPDIFEIYMKKIEIFEVNPLQFDSAEK